MEASSSCRAEGKFCKFGLLLLSLPVPVLVWLSDVRITVHEPSVDSVLKSPSGRTYVVSNLLSLRCFNTTPGSGCWSLSVARWCTL